MKNILTATLLAGFALVSPASALDAALSPAANQAFLAANARQAGVSTLASGLQYKVLRKGFGKRPAPADTVQIYYSGALIDGHVFDGTSPGLPASLAANNVIAGLRQALSMMHEGDRWQLVLPPDLAFGARGAASGAVPPDQTVVFDVTLVSVLPPSSAAPGESGSPFSMWNLPNGQGAMLTLHP